MKTFITQDDYKVQITTFNLEDMIENDSTILESAEIDAIAEVKTALFQKYDTESIFDKEGDNRDMFVVKLCKYLVIFELHKRLLMDIPDIVQNEADFARDQLYKIASGKIALDLPIKEVDTQRQTIRRFSSQPARTH